MTPIESLHTAARHYCVDSANHWHEQYTSSGIDPNSEEARAIYPRYHVLNAILAEFERMTPDDLGTREDANEWLLLAGEAAENFFTRIPSHRQGAARAAIADERIRFGDFVRGVEIGESTVEPLEYRRTISADESRALWARLKERWAAGGDYWYPLEGERPPHSVVFRANVFEEVCGFDRLQKLLSELGVVRAFALNEVNGWEPEYEVELSRVDLDYRATEMYWTPLGLDWVICASHENTITLAGERVVSALTVAWPERERYVFL